MPGAAVRPPPVGALLCAEEGSSARRHGDAAQVCADAGQRDEDVREVHIGHERRGTKTAAPRGGRRIACQTDASRLGGVS